MTVISALRGYNEALKYIDAEIYALVNSLRWPKTGSSDNTNFRKEPYTAIIQPKILDFKINSILNMPEPQVASLINMDTHIVVDAFLTL
jgi:hypothetical protein